MIAHTLCRGGKLIFTGGHSSLEFAFTGPNVIVGLYKCNYSMTRGTELSAAAGWKQGGGPIRPVGLVFAAWALR